MAFRYVHGRERISARRPTGFRVCDRCGIQYTRTDLSWQFEWRGSTLQNLRILVCRGCLDIPNPQLRTFVVPPDPLPFMDPRPELDRGWPMQTYVLRDNFGTIIRANDRSVITVIGTPDAPAASAATGNALTDSSGNVLIDSGGNLLYAA